METVAADRLKPHVGVEPAPAEPPRRGRPRELAGEIAVLHQAQNWRGTLWRIIISSSGICENPPIVNLPDFIVS